MTDNAQRLRQALIRNIDEALADPAQAESFERPPLYAGRGAVLARGTAARQLGCSVDVVPPGQQICPYHLHHAQEEMFIVLEGSGTLRVAGERLAIKAGDVMFLPAGPEYPHHILNTSDAPLKYLSISTRQYPELCEYPDSGKTMAWTPTTRVVQRQGEALDYWDGEP
ncbi:cupin domain-containing protein [Ideonella sp. 4Y11]|uniref:Cupin domain-containing protein n=2 Tax=Ideonella TaxID=36862 RepID=A0A940YMD2_9BURK|nr:MULTISPECIES: cupin domain-containing protein [Ideonella]MBQ0932651.1 cupin domain-containing protein [Ideonella alba]MBQ0960591.1 cupin domain-containing protein [Ideonella aquatica]